MTIILADAVAHALLLEDVLGESGEREGGLCLKAVNQDMGAPTSSLRTISGNLASPPDGGWLNAFDGFTYSNCQRTDLENAPPGVGVFWPAVFSPAGHVTTWLGIDSFGLGWHVTTDELYPGSRSRITTQDLTRSRRGVGPAGWTETWAGTPYDTIDTEETEIMGAAQTIIDIITNHTQAVANNLQAWVNSYIDQKFAWLDADLRTVVRRERAKLYFDAGPDGTTPETQSRRAVVAKLNTGFVYTLNADPAQRAGQLGSLRATHYLLIDEAEYYEGLATRQFDNMIEMANSHIRRIAAEVLRQMSDAGPAIASTMAFPPQDGPYAGSIPNPVLLGYEPSLVTPGDHAA